MKSLPKGPLTTGSSRPKLVRKERVLMTEQEFQQLPKVLQDTSRICRVVRV